MTLDEMISMTRIEANQPSASGEVTDSEIAYYLNRAQSLVALKVMQSDQKYFEQDELLSFVANQEEYDLPRPFRDTRITNVERLNADGTVAGTLTRIRFQEKESFGTLDAATFNSPWKWYPRERKIGFRPKPTATESNAIRVYGIQLPHDLLYFKAQSVSASTLIIPTSTDATNMLAGRNHIETDYYKNAEFLCIAGTGIGTVVKGLSYSAVTRTLTLTAAAAPIITGDSLVLLSKVPEAYHETLVSYAVMKIAAKGTDGDRYKLAAEDFKNQFQTMSGAIEPRAMDAPEVIGYPGSDDDFLA